LIYLVIPGISIDAAFAQMERYYKPVRNFSAIDHKGNNQTLCAMRNERGAMFFGDALGLKTFDGINWKLIRAKGYVFSASVDRNKRIFIGSEGDFGYLVADLTGEYRFVSLAPTDKKVDLGVFWYTITAEDKVFFISNSIIFIYDYHKVISVIPKNRFHKAFFVNGTFFAKEFDNGLFFLNNQDLIPIKGSEIFVDARVDAIFPYSQDTMMLVSREMGMMKFVFNKDAAKADFIPVSGKANKELADRELYCALKIDSTRYAMGTRKGGLLLVNTKAEIIKSYDRSNGLMNNFVRDMAIDQQGGLWLALESGISRVEFDSPFIPIQPESRYSGNIETINSIGNKIFLGTTTGLYVGEMDKLLFERQAIINQACWHLAELKSYSSRHLLVSSTSGLYVADSTGLIKQVSKESFRCSKQLRRHPNIVVGASDQSLIFYRWHDGALDIINRIKNIEGEMNSIEEDKFGNLWVGTRDRGVLFIEGKNFGISQHHNFVWLDDKNGLKKLGENSVVTFRNQIFVNGFDGIFELYGFSDRQSVSEISRLKFVPATWLPSYFFKDSQSGDGRQVWTLAEDFEGRAHISTRTNNSFETLLAYPGSGNLFVVDDKVYKVLPDDQVRAIYHTDSGLSFLGGAEFLYAYKRNMQTQSNTPFDCMIRYLMSKSDTLYFGEINADSTSGNSITINPLSYHYNDLNFYFGATFFSSNLECEFSSILEGEDNDWSPWSTTPSRSFSKLWPGNYTLKVKARNPYGFESKVVEFHFRIIPPWYLTWWAFVIYAIGVLGVLILIVKIYTIGLNRIIKSQTLEIVEQKNLIENKNKEITDSIMYAKRIQDAIMPAQDYLRSLFPRSFVIHRPKDIVSGDFYWATGRGNEKILIAADCTGHGVPGAFMSMMGNDYLNEIIIDKKITRPDEVLNLLRAGIIKALKQKGEEGESKDGMDMALVRWHVQENILDFGGANNPLYLVREKSRPSPSGHSAVLDGKDYCLYEFKGDKFPVGIHLGTTLMPFKYHSIPVFPGDRFYLFSDGYADQFGGPLGKKLKYNQLKRYLLETVTVSMNSQQTFLENHFDQWKGNFEQVDDVLIIGVEV
jgi:serine phosphatase RsbU (regulator of sigma subunit)